MLHPTFATGHRPDLGLTTWRARAEHVVGPFRPPDS